MMNNDQKRCSYKCSHFLDGAVMSICSKYGVVLIYDGEIPPLRCEQCVKNKARPKEGE